MPPAIRIAAALIDDGGGSLLLVRKHGTLRFMLAGGKIEGGETPFEALVRELAEELGLAATDARLLGRFSAPAANEPGHVVDADVFHLTVMPATLQAEAEIEEAIWATPDEAALLPLAPLMRLHVLPLARALLR